MTDKRMTRLCPVCTDGKIIATGAGQRVSTTCYVCNGELFLPADHAVFQKAAQATTSQPTA